VLSHKHADQSRGERRRSLLRARGTRRFDSYIRGSLRYVWPLYFLGPQTLRLGEV
jgi:hypothetical protein